jgi:hypothetical protein
MYRPATSLWLAYAGILATLLAWTVALELLSRTGLESPAYDGAALGLMALTSLLILLPAFAATGLPVWRAWRVVFDFAEGFPPTLAFVVGNLILWQRATGATSRSIGFFEVGISFRVRFLLLIVTATLISHLLGQDFVPLLWLYFGLGLTAVSLARIHEKAADAQSAGTPLPPRRLVQLLAAIAVTVAAAVLLSGVYTPAGIRRFLAWLGPLWRVVEFVLLGFLWLLGWLLNPFLEWLMPRLARILSNLGIDASTFALPQLTPDDRQDTFYLPPWVKTTLRDIGIGLAILAAVLLVVFFLILYLEKAQRPTARDEDELEGDENLTFGGGILRRGLAALRKAARLVQRYGIGRGLLAAISVQNIYANLCRLARRRGYGRQPAQPPDTYLPIMAQAFPDQEERLARITAAYMRVHYGERPVTFAELAGLRADYRVIREAQFEQE